MLVSNEDLDGFLLQPATGGRAAGELLRAARRQDFRVRVLYWVRRQDFLAESHLAKGARTWYSGPATAYPTQGYDHDGNLRRLEAVFGRDNVTAFLYRDDAPNDLAGDLLAALGLARLRPELALDLGRRNASLPGARRCCCRTCPRAGGGAAEGGGGAPRHRARGGGERRSGRRQGALHAAARARSRRAAADADPPGRTRRGPARRGALLWAEHGAAASLVDWQPRLAAQFLASPRAPAPPERGIYGAPTGFTYPATPVL